MTPSGDGRRDPEPPLKSDDYIFTDVPGWVPGWVPGPLRRTVLDLTYDEVHAAKLGLVGVVAGATWASGLQQEAAGLSVALVGLAFGLKKLPDNKPVAGRVVRREPWYFTTVYLLAILFSVGAIEVLL